MSAESFQEWLPAEALDVVSPEEVQYAHGFLLSKPELWFPGFAAHWLPMLHSLDVSASLVSANPTLSIRTEGEQLFLGSLDDELLGLVIPQESLEIVSRTLVPDSGRATRHIVVEYFARRFLTSLASSWSAADSGMFQFETDMALQSPRFAGGVDVRLKVDGEELLVTVAVGKTLLQRLHDLWCSHLSDEKSGDELAESDSVTVELVMGSAYVRPSEITGALEPGNLVELQPGIAQQVTLFLEGEPWVRGILSQGEGGCVIRSTEDGVDQAFIQDEPPEGTTRVRAVLGSAEVAKNQLVRLRQSRSLLPLAVELSSDANLMIADQIVAKGTFVLNDGALGVQVSSRL